MSEELTSIEVRVTPNSSRNQCDGWREGRYWIRLQAVPEKGKANRALVAFLVQTLGVKRSRVTLLAGAKAREKRVQIRGLRSEDVDKRLREASERR